MWFSGIVLSTPPTSNFVFQVTVPPEFKSWQVSTGYTFYDRYPAAILLRERMLGPNRPFRPDTLFGISVWKTANWLLNFLPAPKQEAGDAITPWLTNHPPTNPDPIASKP